MGGKSILLSDAKLDLIKPPLLACSLKEKRTRKFERKKKKACNRKRRACWQSSLGTYAPSPTPFLLLQSFPWKPANSSPPSLLERFSLTLRAALLHATYLHFFPLFIPSPCVPTICHSEGGREIDRQLDRQGERAPHQPWWPSTQCWCLTQEY